MDGLARSRDSPERLRFQREFVGRLSVKGERTAGPFHLEKVDDVVASVENEVDLDARWINVIGDMPPRPCLHVDPGDAQRPAHLRQMLQAQALERQPPPGGLHGRRRSRLPKGRIGSFPIEELEMEEREVVRQLVEGIPFFLSEGAVSADETALLQRLQRFRQLPGLTEAGRLCDVGTGEAGLSFGKGLDDSAVVGGVLEERCVEFVELAAQRGVFREKEMVEIPRHPAPAFQQPPVIRDSTQGHVAFRNVRARHGKTSFGSIELTFAERERTQEDARRHAVVKGAPVAKDLLHDPGRRRSADNEEDVLACGGPFVPE